MTKQSAFTIVTPVVPDRLTNLVELLDSIGSDINNNQHIRFENLRGLHYASFVVIGADTQSPHLLFEGNVDGKPEAFIEQLVNQAGKAIDAIYGHCADYPTAGTPKHVIKYLTGSNIGCNTFYIAWPGMSVTDICREAQLRMRLGELIDQDRESLLAGSPVAIRERLQKVIREDPSFEWARSCPPAPFLVRNGDRLLKLAIGTSALGLLGAIAVALGARGKRNARRSRLSFLIAGAIVGAFARALRKLELGDEKRDNQRNWESVYAQWNENLTGVMQRENVQGQNHLASVCDIKAGRLRLSILQTVLRIINLAARVTANKGSLGGIGTIHFARWVITTDRRRLIFLSNFDGSWEQYLDDFINLASKGLTAVWTNSDNAVGFPRTRWLLWDGARDEQRFKAYGRYSQARTQLWYSAYPNLSVENIANNRAIRRQLFGPLNEAQATAWLQRL